MPARNHANDIRIEREYNAPLKAVWDAWTDPDQVAKWWGPRGFSITTHSKDLRVGGSWAYTMHGPDGTNYDNVTKYLEVETHSKLVYDHGGNVDRPPMFRVTVNFSEKSGKTRMEMTMTLPTPEAAQETKKFIRKAGGESTWDRLAEYLDKELLGTDKFVINRSFECSPERMFQMWTNPEHFSQWLPPAGFTQKFIRAEIKPGATAFYSMINGADMKMYGKVNYLEIDPARIVYTQQFCDENEKVSRHPLAPNWPETIHTLVTLTDEGNNTTRVTIEWEPYGKCQPQEIETFKKERTGMTQGWTGSFDKLESHLCAQ